MANNVFYKLKRQIYSWLICGCLNTILLIVIINNYEYKKIIWYLFSIIIILSLIWWFWIMNLTYKLIKERSQEVHAIEEINFQILKIREDLTHFFEKNLKDY